MKSGDIIKKYQIVSKIADGGMGAVYKAIDTDKQRDVAVKVIHSKFAFETNIRKRFIDEARIQAKLKHPNICSLIHAFDHESQLFLVMEYLNGDNLKDVIKEKGEIPADETVDIILKVLEALKCAHKNNIIHRDVKPSNIMIMPDGKVKVMDFGIAKSLTGERLTETKTGEKLGTPAYMSPEQIIGKKVDVRTDVYSLGIVLYKMLTGKLPFKDNSSDYEIEQFHVQGIMPSLIDKTDCPTWLNDVIQKAVSKNPIARFDSAEAFTKGLSTKKIIPKKSTINTRIILLAYKHKNEEDFNRYLENAVKLARSNKQKLIILNCYEQLDIEWKKKAAWILDTFLKRKISIEGKLRIVGFLFEVDQNDKGIEILVEILKKNLNNVKAINIFDSIIETFINKVDIDNIVNISDIILDNDLIIFFPILETNIKCLLEMKQDITKIIVEDILTKNIEDTIVILENIIPFFIEKNYIDISKKITEHILNEYPDNIKALEFLELIFEKEKMVKEKQKKEDEEKLRKERQEKERKRLEHKKFIKTVVVIISIIIFAVLSIIIINKFVAYEKYNSALAQANKYVENENWDDAEKHAKTAINSGYNTTLEAKDLLVIVKEKGKIQARKKANKEKYYTAISFANEYVNKKDWNNAERCATKAVNSRYENIQLAKDLLALIKEEKVKDEYYTALSIAQEYADMKDWNNAEKYAKKAMNSGYEYRQKARELLIKIKSGKNEKIEQDYKIILSNANKYVENKDWNNAKYFAEKAINCGYKDATKAKDIKAQTEYEITLKKALEYVEKKDWNNVNIFVEKAINTRYHNITKAQSLKFKYKNEIDKAEFERYNGLIN